MTQPTIEEMVAWLDEVIRRSGDFKSGIPEAIRAALLRQDERTLPELPEGYIYSQIAISNGYSESTTGPYVSVHSDGVDGCFSAGSDHFATPRAAVEAAISKIKGE